MNSPLGFRMATQEGAQWPLGSIQFSSSISIVCGIVAIILYVWIPSRNSLKELPCINPAKGFLGFESKVGSKRKFQESGESMLVQARERYPTQPYRINVEMGERIVLPPEFIEEIRNEPNLVFEGSFVEDYHTHLPGFEPLAMFHHDGIMQAVVKKHLTKVSASIIKALSKEAEFVLSRDIGNDPEWREMRVLPLILGIVSSLMVRTFLGEELCRSQEWMTVTQQYVHNWYTVTPKLHMYPRPLRKIVHWAFPECRRLRALAKEAPRLLAPTIAKRREIKQAAADAGHEIPRFDDAFEWLEEEAAAKGLVYDESLVAYFQIAMTLGAVHTTTDLLEQFMIDLGRHPDATQLIRNEVIHHLQVEGMSNSSFYKMKLLDSALKETQRLKPVEMLMLRRRAEGDVRLSNGLVLKKGVQTVVDPCRMRDPTVYENPNEWDPARFAKLRSQTGGAKTAQLVSPNRNHLGFGYGNHVCPGRFFAVTDLKVTLCHLLVKYEWTISPETNPDPRAVGVLLIPNPKAKILIRKREKPEIDFALI